MSRRRRRRSSTNAGQTPAPSGRLHSLARAIRKYGETSPRVERLKDLRRRALAALALTLALATPAGADDLVFQILGVQPFPNIQIVRLPDLTLTLRDLGAPGVLGPADPTVALDLGRLEAPWQTVHAQAYTVGGQPGLTITIPLGKDCRLHFDGGLLVAVTGTFSSAGHCKP